MHFQNSFLKKSKQFLARINALNNSDFSVYCSKSTEYIKLNTNEVKSFS